MYQDSALVRSEQSFNQTINTFTFPDGITAFAGIAYFASDSRFDGPSNDDTSTLLALDLATGTVSTFAVRARLSTGLGFFDDTLPIVEPLTPDPLPAGLPIFATGTGAGVPSQVQLVNNDGSNGAAFAPFEPTFLGGVRVAIGDFNGDGVADIVAAAGPGGGPRVVVFDGQTNGILADFFAYEETFQGGLFVAVGDVSGDATPELVTGPGSGGGPRVKVYSFMDGGFVQSADFLAFEENFRGGVRVAVGDLDGNGKAEVVATPGPTGGPRIVAFSSADNFQVPIASFFAADPNFRGGLFVTVLPGGNGQPGSVVVGPDNFSGVEGSLALTIDPAFLASNFSTTPGVFLFTFPFNTGTADGQAATPDAPVVLPYGEAFPEGVRVGSYLTADGSPGVVTAPGEGGNGLLQFYRFDQGQLVPDLAPLLPFTDPMLAFAPGQSASVYVSGSPPASDDAVAAGSTIPGR